MHGPDRLHHASLPCHGHSLVLGVKFISTFLSSSFTVYLMEDKNKVLSNAVEFASTLYVMLKCCNITLDT